MRSARSRARAGFTLAEMLVVILIIGLTAGVTALSVSGLMPPVEPEHARTIRNASAEAARTGRSVLVVDSSEAEEAPVIIRLLPDGRAIGPGVDPWTGAPMHTAKERPE